MQFLWLVQINFCSFLQINFCSFSGWCRLTSAVSVVGADYFLQFLWSVPIIYVSRRLRGLLGLKKKTELTDRLSSAGSCGWLVQIMCCLQLHGTFVSWSHLRQPLPPRLLLSRVFLMLFFYQQMKYD